MDSTFSATRARSFGRFLLLFWMVGVFVFIILPPSFVWGVGADSLIFRNPSTPVAGNKVSASTVSSPATVESLPLPEETPQPLPGFFSTFFRMILALGLTIGLLYLMVWGLKILWEKRGFSGVSDEGKPLKVLASVYLAPRKTIYLVDVGNRILIVASGNEEVRTLDVITDKTEVEALKKACHQGFPDVFGKFLNRQEARDNTVEAQKIVSEGRQAVGDYLEKIKNVSKTLKEKPGEGES
jgi:flagellar biogenesis protein FliO